MFATSYTTNYLQKPDGEIYIDSPIFARADLNDDNDFDDTGEQFYYLHNTQYSVHALTDTSGSIIEVYKNYQPYVRKEDALYNILHINDLQMKNGWSLVSQPLEGAVRARLCSLRRVRQACHWSRGNTPAPRKSHPPQQTGICDSKGRWAPACRVATQTGEKIKMR